MAKKHHPDRGGDPKQMVLVNRAHDTLMDPAKREHYDLTGEEKPQTAIDIEAKNTIIQAFARLWDQPGNVPKRVVRALTELRGNFRAKVTDQHRKLKQIEARRDEVTTTDGENLWTGFIDSVLNETRNGIKKEERNSEIADRALEMMKAYRSDKKDEAPPLE